jgi:hypothetical protein
MNNEQLTKALNDVLEALQFAEGALLDAVACEDGLDGETGLRIAKMASEQLLKHGRPSAVDQYRRNHPDNK